MDIKQFKAGVWTQQSNYKSFSPSKINIEWIVSDPQINQLLEEANLKLGELNAFSTIVPDVNLFIKMHILKEAVTSNKIEGTRTNIEEAALQERDIEQEKINDWEEVQNYVKAMNDAIEKLKKLPISTRLIKHVHKILLTSVRGQHKHPGEFRSSQNWIGGATINDAAFVPPVHIELNDLLSDLEKFINNTQIKVPHLIKIAIIHYQFETIHPFLDGNGMVGRLLITLYLVSNGLLSRPALYLSDFFEKNRQLYYDNLTNVHSKNNLEQWIKFFLIAVIETSKNSIGTFNNLILLKKEIEEKEILSLNKKIPLAKGFLNYLYSQPIVALQDVIDELKVTKPTANAIITDFVTLKILKETTGKKRNRIYTFERYLNLFK
ncbi:MAG: Fic family protein [Ignavibacteriaceae bacterium]